MTSQRKVGTNILASESSINGLSLVSLTGVDSEVSREFISVRDRDLGSAREGRVSISTGTGRRTLFHQQLPN